MSERGNDREIVLVEEFPIVSARQKRFTAPAYDGFAMTIRAAGRDLVVPIYSQSILTPDLTLYIADIKLNGQVCLLNLYLDAEKRVTRMHAVPVMAREGLSYNLGRDQIELRAGDQVAALGLYDPAGGGERYERWSDAVALPGPEALAWRKIAKSGAAMPFAADLADNIGNGGAWFEFSGS